MEDARGISRGQCKKCPTCVRYTPPDSGLKCSQCGCPPAGHSKLDHSSPVPVPSVFVPCAELISLSDDTSSPYVTQTSPQSSGSFIIQSDRSVVDACTPEPMVMGSICGYPAVLKGLILT